MNWVTVLTCVVLLTATLVRADENNEIDETRPIRIDPILRKALLKALSTLEKESEEEKLAGGTNTATTSAPINDGTNRQIDEILEESTGADPTMIQFHSFVAEAEKSAPDSDEQIRTAVVSAPQVSLLPSQFGNLNQTKNDDEIIIKFDHLDPIKNNDGIKIETIQLARSVSTSVNANEAEAMMKKMDKSKPEPSKAPRTTTTTTTTTTTPAPVYNEDGENIEKVRENDVQIYQAPLVTAFTIQQDEFGMPRNVIPLYKPVNSLPAFAQRNNFAPPQGSQLQPQAQAAATVSQIVPSQQTFPTFFDQRHRELEQQVLLLQNQNRQQEVLLNRQRYLEEQRQNQIILDQRLRAEEENRIRIQRLQAQQQQQQVQQQQQIQQQQQLRLLPPVQSNNVQFVPSISLSPISIEQQLPIREPADFLAKTPQTPQFTNSIQPLKTLLPPLLPTVQQPPNKSFGNFFNPSANNIIPVPENLPQLPLATRNRVFRQESGTSNFARNFQPSQQNFQTQQQNFQTPQQNFQPQQQQQQQNYNFNRQFANSQLQNLLFQSGITPGRSSRDELNIIAKVLSLNHGIQQQQQNNFIDEPRRFVRHAASYYYF